MTLPSAPILAKISLPQTGGIVPRARLLQLLQRLCDDFSVVWINSPAGSGKTKLATSYLDANARPVIWYQIDGEDADPASFFHYLGLAGAVHGSDAPLPQFNPDRLFDLAGFARRYFRDLFARFPDNGLLVLENYHAVAQDARFHMIMREALTEVPAHINVLVLSRSGPPPELARLLANQTLAVIDWDQLRLTLDETQAILAKHAGTAARIRAGDSAAASGKSAQREAGLAKLLHARSGGWLAAVVLLMEQIGRLEIGDDLLQVDSRESLFPYFAEEMFSATSPSLRRFLLRTAVLTRFSLNAAIKITGNPDVEKFLDHAHRQQYFIDRFGSGSGATYQYHALFREFLVAQLSHACSSAERHALLAEAVDLLEANGDVAAAADLLKQSGDLPRLTALVHTHAAPLIQQGRYQTLGDMINHLPQATLASDPWLLFWASSCRMSVDPAGARLGLEPAFAMFRQQGDASGCFLAWSGIVDCIYFESRDYLPLGAWFDVLDALCRQFPSMPSPQVEARVLASALAAMAFSAMDRPDAKVWADRALAFMVGVDIVTQASLGFMLTVYYLWTGQFHNARAVMEMMRIAAQSSEMSDLLRTTILTTQAMGHWCFGEAETCFGLVAQTEAVMQSSGIYLWKHAVRNHGFAAALSASNLALAKTYCAKVEPDIHLGRPLDQAMHRFLRACLALQQGHIGEAELLLKLSGTQFRTLNFRFGSAFNMAQSAYVLHLLGQAEAATAHIGQALALSRAIGSQLAQFMALLIQAAIALECGLPAAPWMAQAMALGRRHDITNYPGWNAAMVARVAAHALALGIETEFVTAMIRRRGLVAPGSGVEIWPWALEIRALGAFQVIHSGRVLEQKGKGSRRTLDLLKAIIAQGGRAVSIDNLTADLWPDADGDSAKGAFDVAIHRLRKLIGDNNILEVSSGKVSLNPRACWLDVWAFQDTSQALIKFATDALPDTALALGLAEKMFACYRGHLLSNEAEQPWTLPHRERLRQQFTRAVACAGQHLEAAQAHDAAAALYQRGIDLDPLAEDLCRRLLLCLIDHGRHAEAGVFFAQWERVLKSAHGVAPSAAIVAIMASINKA